MHARNMLAADGWNTVAAASPKQLDGVEIEKQVVRGGAAFLQQTAQMCDSFSACRSESTQALVLLILLCATIATITVLFAFFREDKEEQITPLCPQLVVQREELRFKMDLDLQIQSMASTPSETPARMDVLDEELDKPICAFFVDWMDPFRQSAGGVAATVRLQSNLDLTLATVVARNIPVVGQGLALCRTGCEIFGFVEPKGNRRYDVRHRTGVHLLTLVGEFGSDFSIEGINPVGSTVCWFKKVAGEHQCRGRVLQSVDAGLIISSILATQVHRRLMDAVPPMTWNPATAAGAGAAEKEETKPQTKQVPTFSDLDPDPKSKQPLLDGPGEAQAAAQEAGTSSAAAPELVPVADAAPEPVAEVPRCPTVTTTDPVVAPAADTTSSSPTSESEPSSESPSSAPAPAPAPAAEA